MYAIHLVDIPKAGNYSRRVTMVVSFNLAELLATCVIQRLLNSIDVQLKLENDNVYDVYADKKFVGYCVINDITKEAWFN